MHKVCLNYHDKLTIMPGFTRYFFHSQLIHHMRMQSDVVSSRMLLLQDLKLCIYLYP